MIHNLRNIICLLVLMTEATVQAEVNCDESRMNSHPLCQAFAVAKSEKPCTFPREALLPYRPDLICEYLKRFAYDQNPKGPFHDLLKTGYDFVNEKSQKEYQKSLTQRKKDADAKFKEIEKCYQASQDGKTSTQALLQMAAGLDLDEDDIRDSLERRYDILKDKKERTDKLVALAAEKDGIYPGIVRAKCRDLVESRGVDTKMEDVCLFGYDYLRAHLSELPQKVQQVGVTAGSPQDCIAPTTHKELTRQIEDEIHSLKEIEAQNTAKGQSPAVPESLNQKVENLMAFLYDKNAGKLHFPQSE